MKNELPHGIDDMQEAAQRKSKRSSRTACELTHARHDTAHCLAPGLFRTLMRGERKLAKLDVTYRYGDEEEIRFWGPEPLGADDLRVLTGLVAMAPKCGEFGGGILLTSDPESEVGHQLRLELNLQFDALEKDVHVVKGSLSQLAHEIGYADEGGSQLRLIEESIKRIFAVSVFVRRGSGRRARQSGYRIISRYDSDQATGRLFVALNPRLTEAIAGQRGYTHIDMRELRAIQCDRTLLMHQRLCGWIDQGKTGQTKVCTLASYIWPVPADGETQRKRENMVRKSLKELATLGWEIKKIKPGLYDIARPAADY